MCFDQGRSTIRLWLKPRPPASGSVESATPCCLIRAEPNNRVDTQATRRLTRWWTVLFSNLGLKTPLLQPSSLLLALPAGDVPVLHRGDSVSHHALRESSSSWNLLQQLRMHSNALFYMFIYFLFVFKYF